MNSLRYILFISLLNVGSSAWVVNSLSFLHYQNGMLGMSLVTLSIQDDVLSGKGSGTHVL